MTTAILNRVQVPASQMNNLSNREVLDAINESACCIAASLAAMVTLIGEAEMRKLYRVAGYRSMRQWLIMNCNLSGSDADNKVRLARYIRKYPTLGRAFVQGSISYSVALAMIPLLNIIPVEDLLEKVTGLTVTEANATLRLLRADQPTPTKYGLRVEARSGGAQITINTSMTVAAKLMAIITCINQMQGTKYQPAPVTVAEVYKTLEIYVDKARFKRDNPGEESAKPRKEACSQEVAKDAEVPDSEEAAAGLDPEEQDLWEEAAKDMLKKLLPDDVSLDEVIAEGFDAEEATKKMRSKRYKKTKFGTPLAAEGADAFDMMINKSFADLTAEEKALTPGGALSLIIDNDGTITSNTGLPLCIETVAELLFNGDYRFITNDLDWLQKTVSNAVNETTGDHDLVTDPAASDAPFEGTTDDDDDCNATATCSTTSDAAAEAAAAQNTAPNFPGPNMYFGRKRRIASRAQIDMLLAAQGYTCAAPNCTHTRYLQAHHIHGWAEGGKTNIDNLILLCSKCHSQITRGEVTLHERGDGALVFRYGGTVSFLVNRRGAPLRNNIAGVMIHDDYSDGPRPQGCTAPPNGYATNPTNLTYLNAKHDMNDPIEFANGPLPAFVGTVCGRDPFIQFTDQPMGDFQKEHPLLPEMFCGEGNVAWVINTRYGFIENNKAIKPITLDLYRRVVTMFHFDLRDIETVTDSKGYVYVKGPITPELRLLIARMGEGYKTKMKEKKLWEEQMKKYKAKMREEEAQQRREEREHKKKMKEPKSKKPKMSIFNWLGLAPWDSDVVRKPMDFDVATMSDLEYVNWVVESLEDLLESTTPTTAKLIEELIVFREWRYELVKKRWAETGEQIIDGEVVTSFDDPDWNDCLKAFLHRAIEAGPGDREDTLDSETGDGTDEGSTGEDE